MNIDTREKIDKYYNKEITSQKLIAYLKKHEQGQNEAIYCKYHNTNAICPFCNSERKYSGFKVGYRCTVECNNIKRINATKKIKNFRHPITKQLILDNVTKQGFMSRKFLKDYNLTEYECYLIVNDISNCIYCDDESRFISYKLGFDNVCGSKTCTNKQRKFRTRKTNNEIYGVDNISQLKKIKIRKQETFFKNYGVANISQLPHIQRKIRETNERRGYWLRASDRGCYELYSMQVRNLTKIQDIQSLENYNLRGPVHKNGYHLDHIYSISDGFKNKVPVEVIAHINNLRFIPALDNITKNKKSDITLDYLMRSINKNIIK